MDFRLMEYLILDILSKNGRGTSYAKDSVLALAMVMILHVATQSIIMK